MRPKRKRVRHTDGEGSISYVDLTLCNYTITIAMITGKVRQRIYLCPKQAKSLGTFLIASASEVEENLLLKQREENLLLKRQKENV